LENVKIIRTNTDASIKRNVAHGIGNSQKSRRNTVKIVSVGECKKCGRQIIRHYPCDVAICTCESVVKVKLEPAMLLDDKSYAKLSNLAKFAGVSIEKVLEVLVEVTEQKLMEKGLLNLVKGEK